MIEQSLLKSARERLSGLQNPGRFEHTLGVAYTAACLAFIYDEDPLKAEYAGLLHDCAKCFSDEELISKCETAGIVLTQELLDSPKVLHAVYAPVFAAEAFGVDDADILNSLRFHTTGRPEMSTLEKIIFTADFIEPGRRMIPGLEEIRKLAFADIDECIYLILKNTIAYLDSCGQAIVTDTIKAFEWFEMKRSFR